MTTKKRLSEASMMAGAPDTAEVLGLLVVVGGGGLGSELQHVLARVALFLFGQQNWPYPMSRQGWSDTQGSSFSWEK